MIEEHELWKQTEIGKPEFDRCRFSGASSVQEQASESVMKRF